MKIEMHVREGKTVTNGMTDTSETGSTKTEGKDINLMPGFSKCNTGEK